MPHSNAKMLGFVGAVVVAAGAGLYVATGSNSALLREPGSVSTEGPRPAPANVASASDAQNASHTQRANTNNSGKGFWVGRFAELDVPVKEGPGNEHPDVTAVFAGGRAHLYEDLVGLANAGNTVASYWLYGLLGNCRRSYRSEAALEEAIEKMHTLRAHPRSSSPIVPSDKFDPVFAERNMRRTYERCRRIPSDAIEHRNDWLQQAADGGHAVAMADYAEKLTASDPEEAFRLYSGLWRQGGAMGAGGLYKLYSDGWNGHAPDLVRAAAYGYIATEYMLRYFDRVGNPHGSTLVEEFRQSQLNIQQELLHQISPAEVDRAFELAQELLETNPACCFN